MCGCVSVQLCWTKRDKSTITVMTAEVIHEMLPGFCITSCSPHFVDGSCFTGYTWRQINGDPETSYSPTALGYCMCWRDTGRSQFFSKHVYINQRDARSLYCTVFCGLCRSLTSSQSLDLIPNHLHIPPVPLSFAAFDVRFTLVSFSLWCNLFAKRCKFRDTYSN